MSRARAEWYACSMMMLLMRKRDETPSTATVFTGWAYSVESFLFRGMLSNGISFEFWARQQRLYFDCLQLLIPQSGDFPEIECAFFVNQYYWKPQANLYDLGRRTVSATQGFNIKSFGVVPHG